MNENDGNPRHSPWAWAGLAMVALVIAAVVVLFLARGGGSGDATASSGAPPSGATSSGGGSVAVGEASQAAEVALAQVRNVSSEPLLDGGRPSVFFMGAEWCPFCAAERWALVEATSRFGTWHGLGELHSRPGQANLPSLPTYDLTKATYSSEYLSLRHIEVADVDGDPLQQVGPAETELVDDYDKAGSIPFLIAGGPTGRYTVELAYSPSLLEGQTFAALRKDLTAGAPTPAVEAIDGEADAITALLCRLDGQKPADVCAQGEIEALGRGLE